MIINGVTLKGSPRPCDVHVLFDLGVLAVVVVVEEVRWCWRTILLLLPLRCPAPTLPSLHPLNAAAELTSVFQQKDLDLDSTGCGLYFHPASQI